MSTLTSLLGSNIMGAGTKMVRAEFAGPVAYVAGGTPCNLATKPAAAAPVTDAALTSPMLANRVDDVQIQIPTAMENLYRVRYVPGAASEPALGLAKVFGPASVVTELEFDFADITDPGLTSDIVLLAVNPGTRVVGAEIEVVVPFASPGGTLTLDIGITGGVLDTFLNSIDMIGVAAGTIESTPGAASTAGMYNFPAAGTVGLRSTSTVSNLDALTAGEAIARVWTIDNDAFGDPATWGEVAAGTNLLAAGLTFNVTAIGM